MRAEQDALCGDLLREPLDTAYAVEQGDVEVDASAAAILAGTGALALRSSFNSTARTPGMSPRAPDPRWDP